MRLRVTVHRGRLGAEEFRVVRPAPAPARALLLDLDRHLGGYVDQEAARVLGALWLLAARSPRSLVHVPMRGNRLPPSGLPEDILDLPDGEPLDLVLAHHTLQFAPARWRELRGRLDRGAPQTADLPEAARAETTPVDHDARHHRENRDRFHQRVAAGTLFMTGSARLFRETARHFLDVARHGPGHAAAYAGRGHYCAEFHPLDGTLGNARGIHVEYCDAWE